MDPSLSVAETLLYYVGLISDVALRTKLIGSTSLFAKPHLISHLKLTFYLHFKNA